MADTEEKTSTNITWLGDGSDAEENTWNGYTFKKGVPVEVKDARMVESAKGNRFYKVDGDDSETVEDKPIQAVLEGRVDDLPENAAFAPQEVLTARRQKSKDLKAAQDEERRNPTEDGGSRTFDERVPPQKDKDAPVTRDQRTSEFR